MVLVVPPAPFLCLSTIRTSRKQSPSTLLGRKKIIRILWSPPPPLVREERLIFVFPASRKVIQYPSIVGGAAKIVPLAVGAFPYPPLPSTAPGFAFRGSLDHPSLPLCPTLALADTMICGSLEPTLRQSSFFNSDVPIISLISVRARFFSRRIAYPWKVDGPRAALSWYWPGSSSSSRPPFFPPVSGRL